MGCLGGLGLVGGADGVVCLGEDVVLVDDVIASDFDS